MPAKAKAAKRKPLTLAQLASYDDILTDALVDHAFYWTTIPKNRSSYHPSRGVREEEISKIIQSEIVLNKDLAAAESRLLATDGLSKFYNGLRTDKEKADFRGHLRRYMQIYLPDSPWEVNSTNRYTIVSHEAAITARRFIKRNETIKYLAGIQVVITPEEEREMTARKKDFSIVVSSRNKCASLFMGPARFANHDCKANAKLVTTGQAGIEIIATTSIDVGEEITVTYAENYFGPNNCECLCKTCEDRHVNGWASTDQSQSVKPSIEGEGAPTPTEEYSLRRRRRDDSVDRASRTLTRTPALTPDMRPRISKSRPSRKSSNRDSLTSDASNLNAGNAHFTGNGIIAANSPMLPPPPAFTNKRTATDAIITPPFTPSKKLKLSESQSAPIPLVLGGSRSSSSSQSARSSSLAPGDSGPSTDITSPDHESPDPLVIYSPRPMEVPRKISVLKQEDSDDSADDVLSQMTMYHRPRETSIMDRRPDRPVRPVPVSVSVLLSSPEFSGHMATPPSSQESACLACEEDSTTLALNAPTVEPIVDPAPTIVHVETVETTEEQENEKDDQGKQSMTSTREGSGRKRKYQKRRFIKETTPPARNRVPGDYTLTPLLLSEPEMAWIRCMVCEKAFVQANAYFTKSSCPRCERHSKLYGYVWPKTEKAGARDKEERILDHRMIHRYLDPESEAKIRGRKRPSSVHVSKAEETTTPTMSDEHQPATKRRAVARDEPGGSESPASAVRRSGRARRVSSRIAAF
ncbi:hypothetical protein SODALDRAFT_278725 [Sodiomyces alkalinus F11]|uniref:Histone-lysine N-methyltransferase SET9 n=1 Tax=Sodiomyces alkalinus (strain CBS 110278 / VKM F-3762 / F11) TaxID=1314773 RepID=A0A3N2PUX1_SODAK|nr:hypothetical protein SODALDRAFT_278725 [Sodiomyces alkalinus F11]ROT38146.1 hypothetical protein SODALDRAFT_278725 [Sodiomyces alkalinus F11]